MHRVCLQYLLRFLADRHCFCHIRRNVIENVVVIQRLLWITVVGPFKVVLKIWHNNFSRRNKMAVWVISASCCRQGQQLNWRFLNSQASKCDPESDDVTNYHPTHCPLQKDLKLIINRFHLQKVGKTVNPPIIFITTTTTVIHLHFHQGRSSFKKAFSSLLFPAINIPLVSLSTLSLL